MALPRIHIPGPVRPGPLDLPAEQARRLAAVLRLRAGAEFLVLPGDGTEWRASIAGVAGRTARATVHDLVRQVARSSLELDVWCGLVRPSRFEWAIEKCVEAGADIIRPLVSERSARGDAPSPARLERWQRIAVEAAEQSGRLHIPVVEAPVTLTATRERRTTGTVLVCDPSGPGFNDVRGRIPAAGRLTVLVGPEGGLTEDEAGRLVAGGALAVSLGPNVLRTETAAVAVTVLVRAAD